MSHLLIFFVLALVLFTILAIFIELPKEVHMNLWSLLVGGTLVTSSLTVFVINSGKSSDEEHVAVAPYAGAQKTHPLFAKVVNGVMFVMGLVVLSFPFIL